MANPQLGNGYTKIANELLEAICRLSISGVEMRILLYIIRRTYGFNSTFAAISLTDIAKGVGTSKDNVSKRLKKLRCAKIIDQRQSKGTSAQTISINKNYEEWAVENCAVLPLYKRPTVVQMDNPTVVQMDNPTVVQMDNPTVVQMDNPTYKKRNKENIKERERKNSPPPHSGSYNCAFVNDDNYKVLASEYDTGVINNYIDKVDNWAHSKGKTLGECSETLRKWLEQDNVPKIDPSISEYESVIGQFLPL